MPAEAFKPQGVTDAPKQPSIYDVYDNFNYSQREPDKLPLSNFPKSKDVISQLPPQNIPAPEGREPLPEDYKEFLKYSNLSDNQESRNLYSKNVIEPMAAVEAEQNTQYQKDVENYNRNVNQQNSIATASPNLPPQNNKGQQLPQNSIATTSPNAYEIPKNESNTAVIDQRLFNPKNELADDETARKSVAGNVSVDLSQKPKGVSVEDYLFSSALDVVGAKYNLTPEQKQTAINLIRQNTGKLLAGD